MAGPWEDFAPPEGQRLRVTVRPLPDAERAPDDAAPWEDFADDIVVSRQPEGGWAHLNRGIADVLGAPIDLLSSGLGTIGVPQSSAPWGGSQSIGNLLRGVGVNVAQGAPQTAGEEAAAGLGSAAGFLVPGAGLARVGMAARSPVISGIASDAASAFTRGPARATIAELLAGAGAGFGANLGREATDGSPLGEVGGALVGGLSPYGAAAAVKNLPGLRMARGAIEGAVAPFTEQGAMNRARNRVLGLTEDAELARAGLNAPSEGQLSLAARTNDPRLMALEQSARDSRPALDRQMRQAEADSADRLAAALMEPAEGASVGTAREAAQDRLGSIGAQLDKRIADAERLAADKIAALTPERRTAESGIIVREELEKARVAARETESALWSRVPTDDMVDTTAARRAYRDILADTPAAQRGDIPAAAHQFLEGGGNQAFKAQESAKEVHGLYSAMRQEARIARAAGENNKARIATDLADSLMASLQSGEAVSGPLRTALNFSRQFHEKFTRGNVGRLLGSERTGGMSVAPELTMESSVGRGGVGGAVAYDDIARALGDAAPTLQRETGNVLLDRASALPRGGRLPETATRNFVQRNRDLLKRAPDANRRIAEALQAGAGADATRATAEARRAAINSPERSAAARLVKSRPGEEIAQIMRADDPAQVARQLMRQARRNPQAQKGLKGALLDDLASSARTGRFTDAGEPILSGRNMLKRMNDPKFGKMAAEMLSPEEMSRVRRIADEFRKVETMSGRLPSVGDVMADQPLGVIAFSLRTMAARFGAQLGKGTSGASLKTSEMASSRMRDLLNSLTNDKAEKLIVQAISGDKDLFEALLTPVTQLPPDKERRVITALVGLGAERAAQNDKEQR